MKTSAHIRRGATHRRRGSVLIFVITILGVLFVTGVALLATMRFEKTVVEAMRQRGVERPAVANLADEVTSALGDSFLPASGVVNPADNMILLGSTLPGLAELPNVHGAFSPIEPSLITHLGGQQTLVWNWFTDVEAMRGGDVVSYDHRVSQINTAWRPGAAPNDPGFLNDEVNAVGGPDNRRRRVADADGDGIADSLLVPLSDLGEFAMPSSALAKVLNPTSNPTAEVYLGLRMIPHGGMVNLNHGHWQLLANLFPDDGPTPLHMNITGTLPPGADPFYASLGAEAALRHRGLIPPRTGSPTRLLGNPDATEAEGAGGDYANVLFPPGETARQDDHRFWPFGFDEVNGAADPGRPFWAVRMNADVGASNSQYDRRHLVTTISHDDQLARGGLWEGLDRVTDVVDLMKIANEAACGGGLLPFEYLDYPFGGEYANDLDIMEPPGTPNMPSPFDYCGCLANPDGCELNPLKGRLRMSLAWLQENLWLPGEVQNAQLVRMVQDAFTLLLLNARGDAWETHSVVEPCDVTLGSFCDDDPVTGAANVCSVANGSGVCVDPATGEPRNQPWVEQVQRTAAALTANLIDFADVDDVPTRVEIRSADFDRFDVNGNPVAGRPLNVIPGKQREYVYGLERQLYITELVANVSESLAPPFLGVELFNPYDVPISGLGYFLQINGGAPIALGLNASIARRDFLVAASPAVLSAEWPDNLAADVQFNSGLAFMPPLKGSVRLLRLQPYGNPVQDVYIVVDEFKFGGSGGNFFRHRNINEPVFGPVSIERPRVANSNPTLATSPWFAPLPVDPGQEYTLGESLGADNLHRVNDPINADLRPVEVLLGNTGALTRVVNGAGNVQSGSFPTTGSMLLLMQYANDGGTNAQVTAPTNESRSFTSRLDETIERWVPGDIPGQLVKVDVDPKKLIDNGHMPVFDMKDVYQMASTPVQISGGVDNLPWGQLVFDYFTALPLDNYGPAGAHNPNMDNDPPGKNDIELPRIDQGGLRVHGRININAAPWKVMAGLPMVPMNRMPMGYRREIQKALDLLDTVMFPPAIALTIGDQLAKGIVAYREARVVAGQNSNGFSYTTGDYGNGAVPSGEDGRGWNHPNPYSRRGTGFMSVGELANVHHVDASTTDPNLSAGAFQIDGGEVASGSYVDAIAMLVALGDWTTTRSHVFTTYGTLRGEFDESITANNPDEEMRLRVADVDSRAIRFQETVDRLPTVFGKASKPQRIGDRVVGKYADTFND